MLKDIKKGLCVDMDSGEGVIMEESKEYRDKHYHILYFLNGENQSGKIAVHETTMSEKALQHYDVACIPKFIDICNLYNVLCKYSPTGEFTLIGTAFIEENRTLSQNATYFIYLKTEDKYLEIRVCYRESGFHFPCVWVKEYDNVSDMDINSNISYNYINAEVKLYDLYDTTVVKGIKFLRKKGAKNYLIVSKVEGVNRKDTIEENFLDVIISASEFLRHIEQEV